MKKVNYFISILIMIFIFGIGLISGCIPEVADIDPPFVQIIYPSTGSVVNGTVQIVASASDENEVKEIRIYIDGLTVFRTGNNFANYSWDTTPKADNLTHYISAVAIDESDNIGYSSVTAVQVIRGQNADFTAPVVTILNPVSGQVVRGTVNIVAEAHDDNEVDRVEFYIDGYLEETISDTPFDYLWDTANVGSGAHTIFVRAFDTNNNSSASPTITVTVDTSSNLPNNNIEPNVTIIAPDRNRVLFSESEIPAVPIKISIRNKSAIDRVELYIDGALQEVFSDNIEQTIGYEWNLKGYGDGLLHSIFVKAFDTPTHAKVDMVLVTVNP